MTGEFALYFCLSIYHHMSYLSLKLLKKKNRTSNSSTRKFSVSPEFASWLRPWLKGSMNWHAKFTKIEKTNIQFSDNHLPIAFIKSSKFSLLTSLNFPHNSAISILGARKALFTQCWSQDATVNSEESSCYRIRSRSCLTHSPVPRLKKLSDEFPEDGLIYVTG